MNNSSNPHPNVYQIVTEQVINAFKKGTVPWCQPWSKLPNPRNFLSGSEYRGVNHLLLRLAERSTPFWLTRGQIELRGGQIKPGERGTIITFWRSAEVTGSVTEDEKAKTRAILKYYRVWNYDQTEWLPPLPAIAANPLQPYPAAEKIIADMPLRPTITKKGDQAYYSIKADTVNIPPLELFANLEGYYATWFHELAHSTRHSSRLDRRYVHENPDQPRVFGSCDYSREELVAELAAAFLCAECGLANHVEQSAAYIAGWMKALADDEKLLVHAAAAAQKAADFIAHQALTAGSAQSPTVATDGQAEAVQALAAGSVTGESTPVKKARKSKRIAADVAA